MRSKQTILLIASLLVATGAALSPALQANAADKPEGSAQISDAASATKNDKLSVPEKASEQGLRLPRRTVSDAEQMTEVGMLSDLRDTRLCMTQLKQQAVNLFQEATRTEITASVEPLETTPTSVNAQMLKEGEKYMPPRKEWLVFYINTLEPIVHLLAEDIQDVDTNGRKSSPDIESRVNPLWSKWREDVQEINKALDEIQDLVGAENNNVPLAKAAIRIYEHTEQLQKVRYKVALIFREDFKKKKEAQK